MANWLDDNGGMVDRIADFEEDLVDVFSQVWPMIMGWMQGDLRYIEDSKRIVRRFEEELPVQGGRNSASINEFFSKRENRNPLIFKWLQAVGMAGLDQDLKMYETAFVSHYGGKPKQVKLWIGMADPNKKAYYLEEENAIFYNLFSVFGVALKGLSTFVSRVEDLTTGDPSTVEKVRQDFVSLIIHEYVHSQDEETTSRMSSMRAERDANPKMANAIARRQQDDYLANYATDPVEIRAIAHQVAYLSIKKFHEIRMSAAPDKILEFIEPVLIDPEDTMALEEEAEKLIAGNDLNRMAPVTKDRQTYLDLSVAIFKELIEKYFKIKKDENGLPFEDEKGYHISKKMIPDRPKRIKANDDGKEPNRFDGMLDDIINSNPEIAQMLEPEASPRFSDLDFQESEAGTAVPETGIHQMKNVISDENQTSQSGEGTGSAQRVINIISDIVSVDNLAFPSRMREEIKYLLSHLHHGTVMDFDEQDSRALFYIIFSPIISADIQNMFWDRIARQSSMSGQFRPERFKTDAEHMRMAAIRFGGEMRDMREFAREIQTMAAHHLSRPIRDYVSNIMKNPEQVGGVRELDFRESKPNPDSVMPEQRPAPELPSDDEAALERTFRLHILRNVRKMKEILKKEEEELPLSPEESEIENNFVAKAKELSSASPLYRGKIRSLFSAETERSPEIAAIPQAIGTKRNPLVGGEGQEPSWTLGDKRRPNLYPYPGQYAPKLDLNETRKIKPKLKVCLKPKR